MKIEMAKLLSEIKEKYNTTEGSDNEIIHLITKSTLFLKCRQRKLNYEILNTLKPKKFEEKISHIKEAQKCWLKKLTSGINGLCYDYNYKLSKNRNQKAVEQLSFHWSELSIISHSDGNLKPIYSCDDLLKMIQEMRNPNLKEDHLLESTLPSLVKLRLKWVSFDQLKDLLPIFEVSLNKQEEFSKCDEIINSQDVKAALQACTRGCPLGSRNSIWKLSFGIYPEEDKTRYYERLKDLYLTYEMMIDSIVEKDIATTVTNDDQYFVFEDFIYQIFLPFTRDPQIMETLGFLNNNQFLKSKNAAGELVVYPPNGFVPYHGFSFLIAPFCYLYTNLEDIYFIFRSFFERHFVFLTTISSHEESILSLCVQFEQLLIEKEAYLCFHMKNIGLYPLYIAFKWILNAFAGYLSNEELLYLWDRIIGTSSLFILPILAVAIISFRRNNVLNANSLEDIQAIFADITNIKVMAVLKNFMF